MTLDYVDYPSLRSRRDRRRLQRLDDQARRQAEAEQLSILQGLALDGDALVHPLSSPEGLVGGPVQLCLGARRVVLSRVYHPAWKALAESAEEGVVMLAGARRYGAAWAFEFVGPGGRLSLLADRVRLLPDGGADAQGGRAPLLQLAS